MKKIKKIVNKIEEVVNKRLGWFLCPAHKQGKEKQNAKWNNQR